MVREEDWTDSDEYSSDSHSYIQLHRRKTLLKKQKLQSEEANSWVPKYQKDEYGYFPFDYESNAEETIFCNCNTDYRGEEDEIYCPRCAKPVEMNYESEDEQELGTTNEEIETTNENEIDGDATEFDGDAEEIDYDGDIEDNED